MTLLGWSVLRAVIRRQTRRFSPAPASPYDETGGRAHPADSRELQLQIQLHDVSIMASRSPAAATPLPRASSAPETPASATPTPPRAVPFPSPQIFDILPPLHALILRLLSAQATGAAAPGGDSSGAPGPGPSSTAPAASQQQQPSTASTTGGHHAHSAAGNGASQGQPSSAGPPPAPAGSSASVAADIAALGPNAPPPLDAKDLPTEASAIKIRIQKARAVVEALPDVTRSVADQEREIEELEERIGRLRGLIGEFGRRAALEKTEQMKVSGS